MHQLSSNTVNLQTLPALSRTRLKS